MSPNGMRWSRWRAPRWASATSPSRADRYRVYLHLDEHGAWFNAGRHVPDAVLRRLTCDGVVRPVFDDAAGRPVRLGRTARVVPNDLRRLILDRDRVCRHPTCTNRFHLDVHHLVHWSDGGRTDPDNLVALCGKHHRAHHGGEFAITGNPELPDGLTFIDGRGRVITGPGCAPTRRPPAARRAVSRAHRRTLGVPLVHAQPAHPPAVAAPATRPVATRPRRLTRGWSIRWWRWRRGCRSSPHGGRGSPRRARRRRWRTR